MNNMQSFIYIVNIGETPITEVLSHTLLLPYVNKKDVSFYFFKNEHNKSIEKKFEDIYINVKNSVIPTTNQNFKIIYFSSDYNSLLNEDITEESSNTLLHYTKKLTGHINKLREFEKNFCSFEHILIFHEPWYLTNQIRTHDDLVKNKVAPLVANINKVESKSRLNICRFTQIESTPKQVAFDLISIESVKLVGELIENETDFVCSQKTEKSDMIETGKNIYKKQVDDFSQIYDDYLPVYKGKMERYLDALIKSEPKISVELFSEGTQFWSIDYEKIENSTFSKISEIICGGKKFCLVNDYYQFENNWGDFQNKIFDEAQSIIYKQIDLKYKFNPKENDIKPNENPFEKISEPGTLREKLHKLLDDYKEKIKNELKKQDSFENDDEIIQKFEKKLKTILSESKPKIKDILSKFPSNKSIIFIAIALSIVIIMPALLFYPIHINLPDIAAMFSTVSLFAIITYLTFMAVAGIYRLYWNKKFNALLSSLQSSINGALEDFVKEIQPKEENESLNRRVLYKKNYDILKNIERKIIRQEKILNQKKKIIESILDLGVLKDLDPKPGEKISISEKDDFFRNIEFNIKTEKN